MKRPRDLADKIRLALDLFPCDLLFVHRDAENQEPRLRYEEIQNGLRQAARQGGSPPAVCVVPVHMQEAWLLFNEQAIRAAAGNPNGTTPLDLPDLGRTENLPDPKAILHGQLKVASGLRKRRLKNFSESGAAILVGQFINDFSPLRRLAAFQRLEKDVCQLGVSAGAKRRQDSGYL